MLTKVYFNFKSLNGLKAHHKLLSLGEQLETSSSSSLETDQVDLCRFMYKLHFQQLLLLEAYTKLLQLLSSAAASSSVTDISQEVNVDSPVKTALLSAPDSVFEVT